jgi:hypothetical protein
VAIDIERPWQGICVSALGGNDTLKIRPLGFSPVPAVAPGLERVSEAYVRETDLVVTYEELPSRDVRPRACWRDLSAELKRPAIELTLFTQTRWLHSHPAIDVQTTVDQPSEIMQFWNSGMFLVRPTGSKINYLEMVFPTDFHGAQLEVLPERTTLRYQLFPNPLEKGVVQVGRIWSVWLDRDGDQDMALAVHDRFRNSPLPLTN